MAAVAAIVVRGYGVASGQAADSPYPAGTIAMQAEHFSRGGLDLAGLHLATVNLSIAPRRLRPVAPRYRFRALRWVPGFPPEDFSLSPCTLVYRERRFRGLIYYPHPQTKIGHPQPPDLVEVIAEFIQGLDYGAAVTLHFRRAEFDFA